MIFHSDRSEGDETVWQGLGHSNDAEPLPRESVCGFSNPQSEPDLSALEASTSDLPCDRTKS